MILNGIGEYAAKEGFDRGYDNVSEDDIKLYLENRKYYNEEFFDCFLIGYYLGLNVRVSEDAEKFADKAISTILDFKASDVAFN